ncbi:MAG: DUF4446 family protein [Selenomonadaceae bacterium]|nr:DUF4446 family protein [Selenomonadaceae bacterium]
MDPITANMKNIVMGLAGLSVVLLIWNICLQVSLSGLKKRYRQMMTGEQTGKDFEQMLLTHIAKTDRVAAENVDIKAEQKRLSDLLNISVNRIGVVRFSAFADTGSDLSYAVALLDQNNDGIVFSSIFGREDSRSYVKPIKNGTSTYTLTGEELDAIRQAKEWK